MTVTQARTSGRCAALAVGWLACARRRRSGSSRRPSAIATAKELLSVKGATSMFDPLDPGDDREHQEHDPPDQSEPVQGPQRGRREAADRISPKRNEIIDEIARLYAQKFTEAGNEGGHRLLQDAGRQEVRDRGAGAHRPGTAPRRGLVASRWPRRS